MHFEHTFTVIVPTRNEEATIESVVTSLKKFTENIVVIDGKSTDATRERAAAAGAKVILQKTRGKGAALRQAIDEIDTGIIVFMDADGSHAPEFIPRLLEHAASHDIVIASRYVTGGATENPASLIWMSRVLNFIYTLVLRIPCRDVSNSFKVYRASMLKGLELECDHFDIVEEMLVKCSVRQRRLAIKEVPFVFKARMFGVTKRDLVTFVLSFYVTLLRLFVMRMRAGRQAEAARQLADAVPNGKQPEDAGLGQAPARRIQPRRQ